MTELPENKFGPASQLQKAAQADRNWGGRSQRKVLEEALRIRVWAGQQVARSLEEVVLGMYARKDRLLLPRDDGLAGLHEAALSLLSPWSLCPFHRYVLRYIWTPSW